MGNVSPVSPLPLFSPPFSVLRSDSTEKWQVFVKWFNLVVLTVPWVHRVIAYRGIFQVIIGVPPPRFIRLSKEKLLLCPELFWFWLLSDLGLVSFQHRENHHSPPGSDHRWVSGLPVWEACPGHSDRYELLRWSASRGNFSFLHFFLLSQTKWVNL